MERNGNVFKILPTKEDRIGKRRQGLLWRALNCPDAVVKEIAGLYFVDQVADSLSRPESSVVQLTNIIRDYPQYACYLTDLITEVVILALYSPPFKRAAIRFLAENITSIEFQQSEKRALCKAVFKVLPESETEFGVFTEILGGMCHTSQLALDAIMETIQTAPHTRFLSYFTQALEHNMKDTLTDTQREILDQFHIRDSPSFDTTSRQLPPETPTVQNIKKVAFNKKIGNIFTGIGSHKILLFVLFTILVIGVVVFGLSM